MTWRWDQGRLEYFKFENIINIAKVLTDFDGFDLRSGDTDLLRDALMADTGLPFAPSLYRVWRNYSRVFSCALLATNIDNRLTVTDVCRRLSDDDNPFTVDEYLLHFMQRFSYPFPGFQDYNITDEEIFPICAIVKMLLARRIAGAHTSLPVDDIFAYLIGNRCTGNEDIEHYLQLVRTNRTASGDELRQVRELTIFISQLNLLKWHGNALLLDIENQDDETIMEFTQLANPVPLERNLFPPARLLSIASIGDTEPILVPTRGHQTLSDQIFIEGRRVRANHLRSERSPRLRRIYFESISRPFLCDMCTVDLTSRYPWVDNILELHHLLPLSSAIIASGLGTSLEDVEPLCPNCHKSVHLFYGNYLSDEDRDDFSSRDEAREIYIEAKRTFVL